VANTLNDLGTLAEVRGDRDAAERWYRECLGQVWRSAADRMLRGIVTEATDNRLMTLP